MTNYDISGKLTQYNFDKEKKNLLLYSCKMKKFLITILAFVYLAVSSGATINVHYCMGKLKNWDLMNKQGAKCDSCGMDKTGHQGCCKDQHKTLNIEKDQKITEASFQFLNITSDGTQLRYSDLPLIYASAIVLSNPVAHAPPPLGTVPIFILNCHFRI